MEENKKRGQWVFFMRDKGKDIFMCSECRRLSFRKPKECDGCGSYMEPEGEKENG